MRLFFGCYAPPAAVRVARGLNPWLKSLPAKLVESHNLHFTLVFLGEVSSDKLSQLSEIGERAVKKVSPLQLSLTKLELIPTAKNSRVLAIHTVIDNNFKKLQRILMSEIKKLGINEITGKPHFTLARLKDKISLPFTTFKALHFKLYEINLIQSTLSSTGPVYQTLKTFKIGFNEVLDQYRPNVSICLINSKNQVFLVKNAVFPGEHWQLPQGGIEPGEIIIQAAKRELAEETGITNVVMISSGHIKHRYKFPQTGSVSQYTNSYIGQEQTVIFLRFTGQDQEIKLNQREVVEYQWVVINQVVNKVASVRQGFTQKVIKELKQLINYD